MARGSTIARNGFWLVPLVVYVVTGSQTPGWADAPLIAKQVHDLDLRVWVNNHNLFTLLAAGWVKVLPRSVELHHALNLLCGVLGALTVHVIFLVGLGLSGSLIASALGASALMLSHSLWWHSTMLEVYTLSSLLLALMVLFVLRYEQRGNLKELYLAAFSSGLACSNHVQMSLMLFAFLGILALRERRHELLSWANLGWLLLSFFAGFQIYLWIFSAELVSRWSSLGGDLQTLPAVLGAMIRETVGAGYGQYMFPSGFTLGRRVLWWLFFAGLVAYNFPSLALLLGPLGAWRWFSSGRHRLTLTFVSLGLVAQAIWAANYFIWDMYAFSIPVYVLFAIFVTVGIGGLIGSRRVPRALAFGAGATLFLSPLIYSRTPAWLASSQRAVELLHTLPQYGQATAFWDPIPYFFDPNKRGFDQVEKYSVEAMNRIEKRACYWGDEAKLLYPLKYYYQHSLGRRPDIEYHLIFALLERDPTFRAHASEMVRQLRRGCAVYVSSIGYPERNVLNHVYVRLGGDRLSEVAELSPDELIATFPMYRLEPVELDANDGAKIYELVPRASASPGDR